MEHFIELLKKISWKEYATKRNFIVAFLLVLVVIEALVLLRNHLPAFRSQGSGQAGVEDSLKRYAEEEVRTCENKNYRPSCYDKEIPKLMDVLSMEDAFKVTALVQDIDRTYTYCHTLGHELSAREVKKNPDDWKNVVSRCPTGMCSNGCIHGGFQERFRSETFTDAQISIMKPELADLCEERANWHPTGMEQASCYHALGHLTMYLTNADIHKSLHLCDEFAIKTDGRNFKHLCYDGAFMQIYQPLEPEDFTLIAGKEVTKDTLESFCKQFTDERYGSCFSESWPLFREELANPAGLISYCSKTIPSEVDRCYDATIYVMAAQFGLDSQKILAYCPGLPGDRAGRCFANAASRMIETDYRNMTKAVDLCTAAENFDPKNQCFKELLLYAGYNYHRASPEFLAVCNALPDPWKSQCLTK